MRSGATSIDCSLAPDSSHAVNIGTMNTPIMLESDVLNIAPPILPPARLENNTAVEMVVGRIERNKIPIRKSGLMYSEKRVTTNKANNGTIIKLNV